MRALSRRLAEHALDARGLAGDAGGRWQHLMSLQIWCESYSQEPQCPNALRHNRHTVKLTNWLARCHAGRSRRRQRRGEKSRRSRRSSSVAPEVGFGPGQRTRPSAMLSGGPSASGRGRGRRAGRGQGRPAPEVHGADGHHEGLHEHEGGDAEQHAVHRVGPEGLHVLRGVLRPVHDHRVGRLDIEGHLRLLDGWPVVLQQGLVQDAHAAAGVGVLGPALERAAWVVVRAAVDPDSPEVVHGLPEQRRRIQPGHAGDRLGRAFERVGIRCHGLASGLKHGAGDGRHAVDVLGALEGHGPRAVHPAVGVEEHAARVDHLRPEVVCRVDVDVIAQRVVLLHGSHVLVPVGLADPDRQTPGGGGAQAHQRRPQVAPRDRAAALHRVLQAQR
mmetsp:Transcript_40845/g.109718  ORF Transcript_40845/g.109718 Transcript_40845/m.109718 type:complete len:388 (+) Transcript_40845:132-1295(+)